MVSAPAASYLVPSCKNDWLAITPMKYHPGERTRCISTELELELPWSTTSPQGPGAVSIGFNDHQSTTVRMHNE